MKKEIAMSRIKGLCREMVEETKKEYHHFQIKAMDSMGFITYRCTSRCHTCNIWKRRVDPDRDELKEKDWMTVLSRLKQYGIRSFEVFGGDALIRKDTVLEILSYCKENDIATYFPTNANLCDRETVKELIDAGLGTVYLSIDDIGEMHDKVRGVEGTFSRVKEALDWFVKERGSGSFPKIIVCTTISNLNYKNFPALLEFLEKYPIDAVYPRPLGEFSKKNVQNSVINGSVPEPYFTSSDGNSHLMSIEELHNMKQVIHKTKKLDRKLYVNYRTFYGTRDDTFLSGNYDFKHCHIATTFVTVNPNGDVVPCPSFRSYVIGNLVEEPLEEIWGNKKHRDFIRYQQRKQIPLCRNCNMRVYYPSMLETFQYYYKRGLELCGLEG